MAILRIEELEAYIKYIYKKNPETQYSLKKLKSSLESFGVENTMQDVSLLHSELYDPNPHFSDDDPGYDMNSDFPVIPVDSDENLEEDIRTMRNLNLQVNKENTHYIAKLYGDGLDDFYNDEKFR